MESGSRRVVDHLTVELELVQLESAASTPHGLAIVLQFRRYLLLVSDPDRRTFYYEDLSSMPASYRVNQARPRRRHLMLTGSPTKPIRALVPSRLDPSQRLRWPVASHRWVRVLSKLKHNP